MLAVSFDLHIPDCRSLKAKRAVVKPIVMNLRRRLAVAASEVDYNDKWQRTRIGIAIVAPTQGHANEVAEEVERYIWSRPDVNVLDVTQTWVEIE